MTTFINRDADIVWLKELAAKSRTGNGQFILLEGEAGIGKTELLAEFVRRESYNRILAVTGKCPQFTGSIPYQPFHDIVSQLLNVASEDVKKQAIEMIRHLPSSVMTLFPELGAQWKPEKEVELENERALPRFMDIFAQLITAFGTSQKLLFLLVDDLQWADEGSIALFSLLAKRCASRPMMIAGALRSEEIDENHPLRSALASLAQEGFSLNHWRLAPFTKTAIREAVQHYFGGHTLPPDELVQEILQASAGNPFHLWQVLDAAKKSGALRIVGDTWEIDKRRMENYGSRVGKDIILHRFHLLPTTTQVILQFCTILEREIALSLLSSVTSHTSSDIDSHLEKAVDSGLILRGATHIPGYVFPHDKYIEIIRSTVTESDRNRMHLKIAEYFLASTKEKPNDEFQYRAAFHFLQSGQYERALPELYTAGKLALSRYAYRIADDFLGEALRLFERVSPEKIPSSVKREDIWESMGDAKMLAGDYSAAIDVYKKPMQPDIDDIAHVRLVTKVGTAYFHAGQFVLGLHYFSEALAHFHIRLPRSESVGWLFLLGEFVKYHATRILPSFLRKRIHSLNQSELKILSNILNRTTYLNYFFNVPAAMVAHYRAMRNNLFLDDCHEKIETLGLHAGLLGPLNQRALSKRTAEEALRISKRICDPYGEYKTHFYLGFAEFGSGHWKEAEENFNKATDLFKKVGDWFFLETTLIMKHFMYYFQGRMEDMRSIALKHREASFVTQDLRARLVDAYIQAYIRSAEGKMADAYTFLHTGRSLEKDFIPDRLVTETNRVYETLVLLFDRKYSQALETITSAVTLLWRIKVYQTFDVLVLPLYLESALYAKKGDLTFNPQEAVTKSFKIAKQIPWAKGLALRAVFLHHLIRDNKGRARKALQQSNYHLEKYGMRYEIAHNCRLMSEWLHPASRELREKTIEDLRQLGVPQEAELLSGAA